MFLPVDDRYSHSKQHLESQLSSLFGGRIAEQQIYGDDAVTTGASNDIERATSIARSMVTQWGLSDRMGPLSYSEDEGEVFLGKSYGKQKTLSDETAQAIDSEIRTIISVSLRGSKRISGTRSTIFFTVFFLPVWASRWIFSWAL